MTVRVLTGINTTGTLHLGNYCGAIRPCIQASRRDDVESFFFMADLHALIKCQDPDRVELSRMQIAASWLAAGLDPDKVTFYRQSDIPEIPMLNWMFNCVCSKGLMNRAHAYKAVVDVNTAQNEDPDAGVNMGLFCYPILMAADILMFNANRVPVGRDQIQHLEMARDIATRFNNIYGASKEFFVMPYEQVDAELELLPGLDGRKMSKSYDNFILLSASEDEVNAKVKGMVTDPARIRKTDPGHPEICSVYAYHGFFNKEEQPSICAACKAGEIGCGQCKKRLMELLNEELAPVRDRRAQLENDPGMLDDIINEGNAAAREAAQETMALVREAMKI